MAKKWYGSVNNRIEEGKNYIEDKQIRAGTDITMYYWSDRTCYYVTKVNSQKDIEVKRYYVCADHSKPGGMGRQNWLYFKTLKDQNKYLNSVFKDRDYDEDPEESNPENWVFRYGKWKKKEVYKLEDIDENTLEGKLTLLHFSDKDKKTLKEKGELTKYFNLSAPISFGVRDYYYDWSF